MYPGSQRVALLVILFGLSGCVSQAEEARLRQVRRTTEALAMIGASEVSSWNTSIEEDIPLTARLVQLDRSDALRSQPTRREDPDLFLEWVRLMTALALGIVLGIGLRQAFR